MAQNNTSTKYRFIPLSHPYSNLFIQNLNKYGIDGLLKPEPDNELYNQQASSDKFEELYNPTVAVNKPYPKNEIDFSHLGAYSIYNWEIFFHTPMMIADRLSKNQKFEEAQKWFHYIFDPTESEGQAPQRYWKLKPFIEYNDPTRINDLLDDINKKDTDSVNQVKEWEQNPFSPHLIARMRLVAYMKNVLMKYLDNLIAWGDSLFRKDSIEYINEATQIYILAAQILGRKPVKINQKEPVANTFANFKEGLDGMSNIMVEVEDNLYLTLENGDCNNAIDSALAAISKDSTKKTLKSNQLGSLTSVLYYCIPENKKMLSYWDTVADRLFKIRHCMNIEGVERQLALFEAPIDPALLVKAVANGVSIGDAMNDMTASLPNYRFRFMIQKALELTNDVKSLGQSLLSTLEKQDAEQLSLLRAGHETNLLDAITGLKDYNIKEAVANIDALTISKTNIESRRDYYLNKNPRIKNEELNLKQLKKAQDMQMAVQMAQLLVGPLSGIPEFDIGVSSLGPVLKSRFGGSNLSSISQSVTSTLNLLSVFHQNKATVASIKGGYDRRQEDWDFQTVTAEKEVTQITKQLIATGIRKDIADKDLLNHKIQIENSKEAKDYMESKYTNAQLYSWMSGELSSLYFQAYQLAYDVAKKAEKALQFELGKTDTSYIKYGNWDSLKKGLLSGDKLHQQLKQMDIAYIEQNKREYEVTKQVSLAMLDANALLDFKDKGSCEFQLPEILFDLDFPGHYFRRIKNVSITIPAVTGPYTNINCKLSLVNSKIRIKKDTSSGYAVLSDGEDRFAEDYIAKTVATSSGRNDAGIFEVNFNDERYLPFEGKGVISTWKLELPDEFRAFDYDTISDVILNINYTAKEGGLAVVVKQELSTMVNKLSDNDHVWSRFFSLKAEFSDNLSEIIETNSSTITVNKKLMPYLFNNKIITVNDVLVIIKTKENAVISGNIILNEVPGSIGLLNDIVGSSFYSHDFTGLTNVEIIDNGTSFPLELQNVAADAIDDIILVLEYTVSTV